MHRSRSRLVLVWTVPCLLAFLFFAAPAAAQTHPNADAYRGMHCFATVMSSADGPAAMVTAARDPGKEIFGKGDALYLTVEPGARLAADETYDVYRREGRIDNPRTGHDVGTVIVLVGSVRIVDVSGDRAMARVEDACGEIEAGDRLRAAFAGDIGETPEMPRFSSDRLIAPMESDATVVYGSSESLADSSDLGRRRSTLHRRIYAAGDVVTVDRGSVHGWTPGSSVLLYDPSPALVKGESGHDDEPEVVGQGYVIWADADTAALLITDGDRAVELGVRARLLGGS